MVLSIEFNHIMQMLNEIRIGGAKSLGFSVLFFALSLSCVFFALSVTVEDNLQYIIFGWYFFIVGCIAIGLTWSTVKNMRRRFFEIMAGIEKLKEGPKKK